MPRNRLPHFNTLSGAPADDDGTAQSVKNEFARRLEAKRVDKGWNQSELARRTSAYLKTSANGIRKKRGEALGRDQISHYTRGISLPRPEILRALARALECEPADLLPPDRVPSTTNAPAFRMTIGGDGRVQIMVNRIVSHATAMQIMGLLTKEDNTT